MVVLVTAYKNNDVVMSRIYTYLLPIIERYREKVFPLLNENDTRENFERYVREFPKVAFHGHGFTYALAGYRNQIILDPKNIHLLKGKDVLATACLTAYYLGELAMKKGAKSYIGYIDELIIPLDPDVPPERDRVFALFAPFLFYPLILQLEGYNPEEIYLYTTEFGKRYAYELIKTRDPVKRDVGYIILYNISIVYQVGVKRPNLLPLLYGGVITMLALLV